MKKYVSEIIGTFVLVFVGTAAVTIGKADVLGIGLAFGLAVTIMAYSVGAISGGHFNPAVTLGMWINKRISGADAIYYVISQFIGAVLASGMVKYFLSAMGASTSNLGQTDFAKISAFPPSFINSQPSKEILESNPVPHPNGLLPPSVGDNSVAL